METMQFLCPFEKLQKATISFVMSAVSGRIEQLDFHWTDFDETLYLGFFGKYIWHFQVSLKPDKNNGYFT
jgi:hypothetical protein